MIYDIHTRYACPHFVLLKGDQTLQSLGVILQAGVKAVKPPQPDVEYFSSSLLFGNDDEDEGK